MRISVKFLGILVLAIGTFGGGWADEPSPDWVRSSIPALQASEYHFEWEESRLEAPNRAQGLRVRIDGNGISVVPRERPDEGGDFHFSLSLRAILRGEQQVQVQPGQVISAENRAEIRHASVTEWFVNDPRGLKHGLTLAEAPDGGTAPLELLFVLGQEMLAYPEGQDAIRLARPDGSPALRYSGLEVSDARDEVVPARMRIEPGTLVIEIDDSDAVYPLTVDPLLSGATWNYQGGQDNAVVGAALSTAGDVNGDGYSDVLIAAYGYDGGHTNEGRVWLFYGGPGGLSGTAGATLESNQTNAQFGFSVGPAGDIDADGFDDFLVGGNTWDGGQTDEGAVWVYRGSSTGPLFHKRLEANQAGAHFGRAVAPAGDVNGDGFDDIIATAWKYDTPATEAGRSFVFHGNSSGIDSVAAWTADGDQAGAHFGTDADTAGDVNGDGYSDVIIGAFLHDSGFTDEGAAYMYFGSPSGLLSTPFWTADTDQSGARLGISVCTAGDVNGDGLSDVIVGAYRYDGSLPDEGAAFLYLGAGNQTSTVPSRTWLGGQTSANLGRSVFTIGDVNGDGYADVAVGANQYTGPSGEEGKVQVYLGSPSGPASFADQVFYGEPGASSEFGKVVAAAGDVNGDGFSDLLVGDPTLSDGNLNEGGAFLYRGASWGKLGDQAIFRDGMSVNQHIGYEVELVGDVNGDGFSDVLVEAWQISNFYPNIFVFEGYDDASTSGLVNTASFQLTDIGRGAARAGDTNGDGYDDLAVTLWPHASSFVIYRGGPQGLDLTFDDRVDPPNAIVEPVFAGDINGDGFADLVQRNAEIFIDEFYVYYGSSAGYGGVDQVIPQHAIEVAAVGDVNGDGFSDVIVNDVTLAYTFHGSADGLAETPIWSAQLTIPGLTFGSVASAGDVNGDGYSDALLGVPDQDAGAGRVFGYLGGPNGLGFLPSWQQLPPLGGPGFGQIVRSAGDVNGDGYSDVVIGQPQWDSGSGSIWLYFGSASGLSTGFGDAYFGSPGTGFAHGLSPAGDFNGDGYADILVGSPDFPFGSPDEGRFFVFLGNDADPDGFTRLPRQQEHDLSDPIALLGRADSESGLGLGSRARSAAGRVRVRVEHEVKPLGSPFDLQGTVLSGEQMTQFPDADGSWLDVATQLGTLSANEVYQWRLRFHGSSPYFRFSPWYSMPGNGSTEWDLRTGCEDDTWYQDSDADGFGHSHPDFTVETCNPPSGYVSTAGDCNDGNPGVWDIPGEATDLLFARTAGLSTLSWSAPADFGGTGVVYDVLRTSDASDFDGAASCVEVDVVGTQADVTVDPVSGEVFHYVVRAGNACGEGTIGFDWEAAERQAGACP